MVLARPTTARRLHQGSPITHVKNVKTRHCCCRASDATDPIGQSQQFYRGLKRYGVESDFVLYPREPHGLREQAPLDRQTGSSVVDGAFPAPIRPDRDRRRLPDSEWTTTSPMARSPSDRPVGAARLAHLVEHAQDLISPATSMAASPTSTRRPRLQYDRGELLGRF
jgi:hypothetical protein